MTVDILGVEYTILEGSESQYPALSVCDGYTDTSIKTIVIPDFDGDGDDNQGIMDKSDLGTYKKQLLRHEILHAYLFESGLDACSNEPESWARNEEMVDWFAIQTPKLYKTFLALDII